MEIKDTDWDNYKSEHKRLIDVFKKRIKFLKKKIKEIEKLEKSQ